MLFHLTRNCEDLLEVGDHPGLGESREMAHELQHQVGPRLTGVHCVVADELRADDVQDVVRGQGFLGFSSR